MAVNTAMNIIWATFDMLNQELYKSIPLNDSDSFANLWVIISQIQERLCV